MCGIVGIRCNSNFADEYKNELESAVNALSKRGPDYQKTYFKGNIGLGHARLSIIDTSDLGVQPMQSTDGRFTIVFNGEIYNYKTLKQGLIQKGYTFKSSSDTEVLLNLFAEYGSICLEKINGFFAFAIFDNFTKELFIARDRIGIKPLYIYKDDEKLIFSSELKAIFKFNINKEIEYASLYYYLQLNYIPGPLSILKQVKKLLPGNYILIKPDGEQVMKSYYTIPKKTYKNTSNYNESKNLLLEKLEESIRKRLIADVPLGAFLSGGIDSSIIVALASKHTHKLNTFSIGYADEPLFDETHYAELVAKKFNTNHTTFKLTNDDLFNNIFNVLDYIDEPFADSSAIAVYILSKYTKNKVTVALSGDGADELFSGYNKHYAEYKARQNNLLNLIIKLSNPLLNILPKSRNTKTGNLIRQLHRYSEGVSMSSTDRYYRWCAFVDEKEALNLLQPHIKDKLLGDKLYGEVKADILSHISESGDFNEILYSDLNLVLQNDMLVKVDLMSMANSLEVRVPFLDHDVVDFVAQLPSEYKIGGGFRKKILKDTFREILPKELYNRPKQGFEVPLLKWFKTGLKDIIENDLLSDDVIKEQNVFNPVAINNMKKRLFSNNPGEVSAQIWGLVVFQYWWKKYIN